MSSFLISLSALCFAIVACLLAIDVRRQLRELRSQLFRPRRPALSHGTPRQPVVRRIGTHTEEANICESTPTTESFVTAAFVKPLPMPPSDTQTQTTTKIGWEERLGAQLPIWIGAIALMLAGVFMVRYFAEQGMLGPTTRMMLAAAFGVVMIVAAQWLRRHQERIAQGLAAAGISVLYATLLGSVNLHQLISPAVGIVGMIAVTVVAVVLSLQHGQLVALCGLAGGFLMPALLTIESQSAAQLFGYLFLLQTALMLVSRQQRWNVLPLLTLIGAFVWLAGWMLFRFDGTQSSEIGLFLLATIAATVLFSSHGENPDSRWPMARWTGFLAMTVGLPLSGWLIAASNFAVIHWVYLGVLGAGCIVLARIRSRYFHFAVFAWAAPLVFLAAWGASGSAAHPNFTWTCVGFGLLWSVGSYLAAFGTRNQSGWLILSGIGSAATFLLCFEFVTESLTILPWWIVAVGMAFAYFVAAIPVGRHCPTISQTDEKEHRRHLAIVLMTALGFAAFAVPLELERQWITVGWALMLPGIAVLIRWLKVPSLRYAIGVLTTLVTVRLLSPFVLTYPIGEYVIFNWLLYGYGLPITALLLTSRLLNSKANDRLRIALNVATSGLSFVLITLLVRHGFHAADFATSKAPQLMEFATYSICWSGFGAALLARFCSRNSVLRWAGLTAIFFGLAATIVGCGVIANPLWTSVSVGSLPIANDLVFAFGIPAGIAAFAAWLLHKSTQGKTATGLLSAAALLLTFVFISLEVRQGFQGEFLNGPSPRNPEWYSYSVAWLLLAATLLVAGLWTGGRVFRWGSLVILLTAIGKVFIVDASHLQDLWRVVSFLGLGLCLLGVAWIYQHFVFGKHSAKNCGYIAPEKLPTSS